MALNIDEGKQLRKTHAMHLALFPTHQKEHIHTRIPHKQKCDQKSEVLSYNLDQNIAVTEDQTYRCYENDGLLSKGVGLAGGKAEQSYFQGMVSVNWAIFVRFPSLDISCYKRRVMQGNTHAVSAVMRSCSCTTKPMSISCIPPKLSPRHFSIRSSVLVSDGR